LAVVSNTGFQPFSLQAAVNPPKLLNRQLLAGVSFVSASLPEARRDDGVREPHAWPTQYNLIVYEPRPTPFGRLKAASLENQSRSPFPVPQLEQVYGVLPIIFRHQECIDTYLKQAEAEERRLLRSSVTRNRALYERLVRLKRERVRL